MALKIAFFTCASLHRTPLCNKEEAKKRLKKAIIKLMSEIKQALNYVFIPRFCQ